MDQGEALEGCRAPWRNITFDSFGLVSSNNSCYHQLPEGGGKKTPKTTTGSASLHFGRIYCKCNSLYLLSQCSKIQYDNDSLKKLYNVHFPPRLLQRFMTEFAAQQRKLGRRPCNQNGFFLYTYIYFLPCYIFTLV